MKKLLLSIALLPAAFAAPAQSFYHLSVQRHDGADRVSFSVKREVNTSYYLLEGSREDSSNASFELLGRINAAGNSCLPRTYTATVYDPSIRYYRIRQVNNTALSSYSTTVLPATPLPQQDKRDNAAMLVIAAGNK